MVEQDWKKNVQGNPQYVFNEKLKRKRGKLQKWNRDWVGDNQENLQKSEEQVNRLQVSIDKGTELENFQFSELSKANETLQKQENGAVLE